MTERLMRVDKYVLVGSLVLLAIGIVFVYSSSFALAEVKFNGSAFFLFRHVVRACLALLCFLAFINIDYKAIGKAAPLLYVLAVFMLAFLLIWPEGQIVKEINGAKRWINLGIISFQVSEFARIALLVTLANQIHKYYDRMKDSQIFVSQLVKIGVVCFLIVMEPDFSTASLIGVLGIAMLFVGGASIKHVLAVGTSLVPLAIIAVLVQPYRLDRVKALLSGEGASSYQLQQAQIALGNGGAVGTGLGLSEQKYFFLPEPHTDFVLSILGEEIGFVGLLFIFLIFCLIIYRGILIAINAPDRMGKIMAFGLTFNLSLYVIIHAFVNTGLLPTTGVPFPFISYGGMSLIFTMSSMGILLNISSQTEYHNNSIMKRRGT